MNMKVVAGCLAITTPVVSWLFGARAGRDIEKGEKPKSKILIENTVIPALMTAGTAFTIYKINPSTAGSQALVGATAGYIASSVKKTKDEFYEEHGLVEDTESEQNMEEVAFLNAETYEMFYSRYSDVIQKAKFDNGQEVYIIDPNHTGVLNETNF